MNLQNVVKVERPAVFGGYFCFPLAFRPGLTPARTFRALSMSRSDQSRTFTVPTVTSFGASIVPAAIWRWTVRIVLPSFWAACRVVYFGFTICLISHSRFVANDVASYVGERGAKEGE
jgi:hypothetical protein